MKVARATILAAALAGSYGAANAVWFFFLPLGLIQTAVEGGTCLPSNAAVGDKIPHQGREYRVTATNGTSSRCADPRWPVIGKIELVLTEAELRSEQRVCLMQGATVGMKTTVPGMGEVIVRGIDQDGCSDGRQVSARVVRAGYVPPAPEPAYTPAPLQVRTDPATLTDGQACISSATAAGENITRYGKELKVSKIVGISPPCSNPWPVLAEILPVQAVPVVQAPVALKTTVDKLRDLKQLREENLITQELYEAKQRDILNAQ